MKKKLFYLIVFLLGTFSLNAQQYVAQLKPDSMLRVLKTARDTQRVNSLNLLARRYLYVDQDSIHGMYAQQLSNEAFLLAIKLGYERGIGNALLNRGIIGLYTSKLKQGINDLTTALPLLQKAQDSFAIAAAYDFTGIIYQQMGQNRPSIQYLDTAQKIYRSLKDTVTAIWSMTSKGNAYFGLGDYQNAYKVEQEAFDLTSKYDTTLKTVTLYYMARLFLGAGLPELTLDNMRRIWSYYPGDEQKKKIADFWWVMAVMVMSGEAYLQLNQVDSAVNISRLIHTSFDKMELMQHLFFGRLHLALHQYDSALIHLNKAVQQANVSGQPVLISNAYREAANAYLGKGDIKRALIYSKSALDTATRFRSLLEMKNAAATLSAIYDTLKDYTNAYYYSKLQKAYNDSLMPEQDKRRLSLLNVQNELALQQQHARLLIKDGQIRDQQLRRESAIRKFLSAGIILIILMSIFAYRNILLKRRNEKLSLEHRLRLQEFESQTTKARLEQQAAELEMQALRAQMNPHFIFNCLNAINHFILKNETETASDFLTRFSRLIRLVLQYSAQKFISLHDELEMLKLYISLEKVRFHNHFDYEFECIGELDTEMIQLPPMLLQPFVENAIWHGLMHRNAGGHLKISLREESGFLYCMVEDNGIGRKKAAALKSKSASLKKSMGMEITANRLKMLNGINNGQSYLKIADLEDEEGNALGTRIMLKVPIRYSKMVSV